MAIEVVCALIVNNEKIWMGRRPLHKHMGGYYEFPGGKVDAGETPTEALQRELQEELGIIANIGNKVASVVYSYPDKVIQLTAFWVSYSGQIQSAEHIDFRWVQIDEKPDDSWACADVALWQALRNVEGEK